MTIIAEAMAIFDTQMPLRARSASVSRNDADFDDDSIGRMPLSMPGKQLAAYLAPP